MLIYYASAPFAGWNGLYRFAGTLEKADLVEFRKVQINVSKIEVIA
jgi:hypothetical protein